MRRKIWQIKELKPEAKELSKKHNLPPILIQILLNRDLTEKDFSLFLNSSLADCHNPRLLPDVDQAVGRVNSAVKNREKVLVFGDYDVDGITSLAIFHEYAKSFPDIFSFYIPHRLKEGYGLNKQAILRAKEEKVSLIIAFDCGTNSFEEARLAKVLGIDLIVVDHHSLKDDRNPDCLFINPKRKDSVYPFCDLSSAALSFKFLQALTSQDCYQVLDLVALSLVCDVAPLKGENRILLKEGIKRLKISRRAAIKALSKVSGIQQKNIDTFHIGYILGPRINASGRVAHAKESLQLFLTEAEFEASGLALQLSEYNQLRKNIESQILKEAEQHLSANLSDSSAIVVSGDNWHLGVLGIVASRLADKYNKPSFVISFEKDLGKGSGRSIQNLHLLEMLDQCADSLIEYGGHRKAAGVHISKADLESFKEKINSLIEETIAPEDFMPRLDIDAKINFDQINSQLVEAIESLKPYGEGNPAPQFFSSNIFKKSLPKKIGYRFSVWLSDGQRTFEGIVYDKDVVEVINYAETLDVVFTLQMNTYHNIPQLVVRGCRLSEGQSLA